MSQTALTNALIRHQIFLQRYGGGVNNKAQNEVDRILAVLLQAIDSGELNGFQTAFVSQLFEGVTEIATTGATDLLAPEALWNSNVLASTAQIAVNPSTADQLLQVFNNTTSNLVQGKTIKPMTPFDLTRQYATTNTSQVLQIVRDGLLTGQANKDIQNQLKDIFANRTKHQTAAYVRTMTNQAANVAKLDTYKKAGIEFEEFVAVLDRRVTLVCASNDGKVFPIDEGPRPALHYQCRSMRVPLVNGAESANVGEYPKWLKRQPKSVQVEVLGEERAKLFRSGELTIDQFVDDRGIEYTLDELEQLYDIEIE